MVYTSFIHPLKYFKYINSCLSLFFVFYFKIFTKLLSYWDTVFGTTQVCFSEQWSSIFFQKKLSSLLRLCCFTSLTLKELTPGIYKALETGTSVLAVSRQRVVHSARRIEQTIQKLVLDNILRQYFGTTYFRNKVFWGTWTLHRFKCV